MLRKQTMLFPDGATTSELFRELIKCKDDPVYFIKTYCTVVHPVMGSVPLSLYDYQEDAIRTYNSNKRVIQLSSCQTGKTSVLVGYVLWYAIFNPHKTILFTSPNLTQSSETRNRFRLMLAKLPNWMKDSLQLNPVVDNRREIMFSHYSSVLFHNMDNHTGRGLNISMLVCDEFALADSSVQHEFYASILPAIGQNSKIIIASGKSPSKTPTFFDKLWAESSRYGHPYAHIAWNWDIVPGRNPEWMESMRKVIGEDQWCVEFEVEDTI